MSTIQTANIDFTSTGSTRIQYTNNDTFKFVAGNTDVLSVNSTSVGIGNTNITSSGISVGNSTVNTTISATGISVNSLPVASETDPGIIELATTSEVTGIYTTANVTSGNTALSVANSTGIVSGMYIVGEGIAPGTKVSAIVGANVTLSANANATLSSDPVAFYVASKATSPGTLAGQLCRAWVSFNGTGTVAIRSAYNVSSITDNGSGDYTVNFITAMPDANLAVVATGGIGGVTADNATAYIGLSRRATNPTTTSVRLACNFVDGTGSFVMNADPEQVCVSVYR